MKNAEITVIRAELERWPNKSTGEIQEMTKIIYGIQMSNTDSTVGLAILKGYKRGNHLEFLKSRLMRKCIAEIREDATENGSKYVIVKIDNKEL